MLQRRRRLFATALVAIGTAVAVPLAWADVTQTPVKVKPNPIRENSSAVSAGSFAWAQSSAAHPFTFNLYAQGMSGGLPAGNAVRVNVTGSQGFPGGIDGDRLAYQQTVGRQSDIRYFNLATHHRSNPPPGVNTTSWEFSPTITPTWILFGRLTSTKSNIVLFNLSTRSARQLASITLNRSGTAFAAPGQVNGNYATYYACSPSARCHVWLYDISANEKTAVPQSSPSWDTAPAVSATGTVYWDRSGSGCGNGAALMEMPLGGSPTALHAMGKGYDLNYLQTYNDGSADQVFYTRVRCATSGEDIFKVAVP
jgi:hypothetical protein